jgi:tRNA-Thr(GGU) m(6)t(6)A37 methyltransferase TsaA
MTRKQKREFRVGPIGVIRSPFKKPAGTPTQPAYAEGAQGEVVLDEGFEPALLHLEEFERLWLVYWFDRAGPFIPRVVPYRDTREHGLFATRSPCRPNPIGISVVCLLKREDNVLAVADVDIIDGTPLLNVKPYIPTFDAHLGSRGGWFDEAGVERRRADRRFHRP